MHEQTVELLTEPRWGFDEKGPYYLVSHGGSYGRMIYVDPAPCYAHKTATVWQELGRCQEVAKLDIALKIALISREELSRCNGWYSTEHDYKANAADGKYPPIGLIVLSGKRIPIHPAMTRYLVSHEYGHAVQYHLERILGLDSKGILPGYAEMRGVEFNQDYGPGHWHSNTGEIFANDFRVVVAEREIEFWPHLVPHPFEDGRYASTPLTEWWDKHLKILASNLKGQPLGSPFPI